MKPLTVACAGTALPNVRQAAPPGCDGAHTLATRRRSPEGYPRGTEDPGSGGTPPACPDEVPAPAPRRTMHRGAEAAMRGSDPAARPGETRVAGLSLLIVLGRAEGRRRARTRIGEAAGAPPPPQRSFEPPPEEGRSSRRPANGRRPRGRSHRGACSRRRRRHRRSGRPIRIGKRSRARPGTAAEGRGQSERTRSATKRERGRPCREEGSRSRRSRAQARGSAGPVARTPCPWSSSPAVSRSPPLLRALLLSSSDGPPASRNRWRCLDQGEHAPSLRAHRRAGVRPGCRSLAAAEGRETDEA